MSSSAGNSNLGQGRQREVRGEVVAIMAKSNNVEVSDHNE
jgi:hypothetical protein